MGQPHDLNQELIEALKRLSFAALCRDNTMGDPNRLMEVRAELREANAQAIEVLAKIEYIKP